MDGVFELRARLGHLPAISEWINYKPDWPDFVYVSRRFAEIAVVEKEHSAWKANGSTG